MYSSSFFVTNEVVSAQLKQYTSIYLPNLFLEVKTHYYIDYICGLEENNCYVLAMDTESQVY